MVRMKNDHTQSTDCFVNVDFFAKLNIATTQCLTTLFFVQDIFSNRRAHPMLGLGLRDPRRMIINYVFFFTNDKKWIKCQSSGISRVRIIAALVETRRQRIEYEDNNNEERNVKNVVSTKTFPKWFWMRIWFSRFTASSIHHCCTRAVLRPLRLNHLIRIMKVRCTSSWFLAGWNRKLGIPFFKIRRYGNDDARFRRIWWLSGDPVHFDTLAVFGFGRYSPHESFTVQLLKLTHLRDGGVKIKGEEIN